jgi:hypothetical protein
MLSQSDGFTTIQHPHAEGVPSEKGQASIPKVEASIQYRPKSKVYVRLQYNNTMSVSFLGGRIIIGRRIIESFCQISWGLLFQPGVKDHSAGSPCKIWFVRRF